LSYDDTPDLERPKKKENGQIQQQIKKSKRSKTHGTSNLAKLLRLADFTDKEIRSFVSSFLKFGEIARLDHIIEDAKLSHKSAQVRALAKEILSLCSSAISDGDDKKG
jgi:hypothetical protein